MHFGSVCSGIEAASVAWHPLGWRAAWLAEIDKFASAVLAHHYPSVPNLGDMTKIARAILIGEVPAPDVLCGGTPCQAFSVAGLRESLADARGNLTIKFVEIANAIDHVRVGRGEDECIVFWENVPGVLSTKDNAFGCFLGGLAGADGPLEPPEQRPAEGKSSRYWKWDKKLKRHAASWSSAGAVYGPRRAVAWRTLDAQYFGVAQRRRRVFVVASARKGLDPATVLFEWDGVRRDTAPSREAGETAAARLVGGSKPSGGSGNTGCAAVPNCVHGAGAEDPQAAHSVGCEIGPGGGRFTDLNPTLDTRAKDGPIRNQLAGDVLQPVAFGGNNQSGPIEVATARNACASASGRMDFETETFLVQPIAFDTTQVTSKANFSNPRPGDPCHPLATGAHAPAIAFPANLSATQHASTENLSPALGALNPTAVAVRTANTSANGHGISLELSHTLDRAQGQAVAYTTKLHNTGSNNAGKIFEDRTTCLDANSPPPALLTAMQVRRLTPRECERLQGFPDGYTAIPWRKKPASECPDGPRYKALGNSWAVPNVRWIGQRIDAAVRRLR